MPFPPTNLTEAIVRQTRNSNKKIRLIVQIEGVPCQMELDTGSLTSIVSWSTMKRLLPKLSKHRLQSCSLTLWDYQGNIIPIIGSGKFRVQFKGFTRHLPLTVVEGALPSLLGLDWFESLGLKISGINCIQDSDLDYLTKKFPSMFDGQLGTYKGTPVSFNIDLKVAT